MSFGINSLILSKPIPYFKLTGDVTRVLKEKIGTQEWKHSALKAAEVGIRVLTTFAALFFTVPLDILSSPFVALLNCAFYKPPIQEASAPPLYWETALQSPKEENFPQYQPTDEAFIKFPEYAQPSAPPLDWEAATAYQEEERSYAPELMASSLPDVNYPDRPGISFETAFLMDAVELGLNQTDPTRRDYMLELIREQGVVEDENPPNIFHWISSVSVAHFFLLKEPYLIAPPKFLSESLDNGEQQLNTLFDTFNSLKMDQKTRIIEAIHKFEAPEKLPSELQPIIKEIYATSSVIEQGAPFVKQLTNYYNQ